MLISGQSGSNRVESYLELVQVPGHDCQRQSTAPAPKQTIQLYKCQIYLMYFKMYKINTRYILFCVSPIAILNDISKTILKREFVMHFDSCQIWLVISFKQTKQIIKGNKFHSVVDMALVHYAGDQSSIPGSILIFFIYYYDVYFVMRFFCSSF